MSGDRKVDGPLVAEAGFDRIAEAGMRKDSGREQLGFAIGGGRFSLRILSRSPRELIYEFFTLAPCGIDSAVWSQARHPVRCYIGRIRS